MSVLGRDVMLEVLRTEGVRHIFGNPGSTELPLIDALASAEDLHYVLALQEATAVGMADGYAQATGRPAFLNLHTSAGLGNAIGNLTNARACLTPLVVTAGQQDYRHIVTDPLLAGDLTGIADAVSKWTHEVRTTDELGTVLRRAFHDAMSPPSGPGLRVHSDGSSRRFDGCTRAIRRRPSTGARSPTRWTSSRHCSRRRPAGSIAHRRRRRGRASRRRVRSGSRRRGTRRSGLRIAAARQRGLSSDSSAVERHAGAGRGHGPRHAVDLRAGAARRRTRVHGVSVHARTCAARNRRTCCTLRPTRTNSVACTRRDGLRQVIRRPRSPRCCR